MDFSKILCVSLVVSATFSANAWGFELGLTFARKNMAKKHATFCITNGCDYESPANESGGHVLRFLPICASQTANNSMLVVARWGIGFSGVG